LTPEKTTLPTWKQTGYHAHKLEIKLLIIYYAICTQDQEEKTSEFQQFIGFYLRVIFGISDKFG
jgi:hypothetical protein